MKPVLQFESRSLRLANLLCSGVLTRLLLNWAGYQQSADEFFTAKALVHLLAMFGMSVAIEDSLLRISRTRLYVGIVSRLHALIARTSRRADGQAHRRC